MRKQRENNDAKRDKSGGLERMSLRRMTPTARTL
jgi:hypothetical protein